MGTNLMQNRLIKRFSNLWSVIGQKGAKLRFFQFIEAIWLAGTYEFSFGEYWVYGFHLKGKDKDFFRSYLPSKIYFSEVLPALTSKRAISFLENKWLFFLHCKENGIRTPQCYGIYHPNSGFLLGGKQLHEKELISFIQTNQINSFIIKPISGIQGKDIYRITVTNNEDSFRFNLNNAVYDVKSILKFLADSIEKSNNCGFLIQEYIDQHENLAKISPSASMNIRIITVMRPNGEIVITNASTRIGRSGATVSNAGSGGFLAKLDIKTGIVTRCRSSGYIDSIEITDHPDTGHRILDSKIPFWNEIIQLCCDAARLIPGANSIGWDVLISNAGPVLLEGNHDWCVVSEQIFGDGYLNDKNIQLLSEHKLHFSKPSPLDFRLRKVLQFVR